MTASPESSTKIDIAEYGFDHPAELRLAAAGMLIHLQRLGIQVLPAGGKNGPLIERLRISTVSAEESTTVAPATGKGGPEQAASSRPTPQPSPGNTLGAVGSRIDQPHPENRWQNQSTTSPETSKPAPVSQPARPASTANRFTVSPISAGSSPQYDLPVLNAQDRQQELDAARQKVAGCRACPELVIGRRNTVYGEGHLNPRVCFLGEAPGAEEDKQGKPFVGPAGQLLTKMIQACTFTREECYILNTIKCRPPGNRTPEQQEVQNCRGFFEHQLAVLQPEYIVCLGLVAANALLQTTQSIGRLRGVFHKYKTSKVVVTYHPAYLLRNNDAKRAAWDDLQMLMRDMGIDPKARK